MTEANEERLERLQSLGVDPQTTVWDMGENDLVWLIEQAERVQELEKENKITSCLYYSMEKHRNEIREKCRLAYGEIYELKVEKSVRGIFDKVELSDDVKDLNLSLMKTNAENIQLHEALKEVFELAKHDNQSRYLDKCYVVARQALEGTK